MPKPAYNERIQFSPNCHSRDIGRLRFGAGHTQQGGGTAASLANYLCNPSSKVSYHYVFDNDRNVVAVVDTDMASWSVGNGNDVTLNYCYAGSYAEWSRQEWLDKMGNAIEIHAYLWVLDAIKYRKNARVLSWADIGRPNTTGATDHRGINEAYLGAKGHTDCGPGYPWDVFDGHVARFLAEGVEPEVTVTAIEACRAANEWLGDKVSEGRELTAPDGVGRFAHYQFGSIYWHPDLGAFALTLKTWGKFEEQGYEEGTLGYPIAPHLVLVPFTKSDGTTVPGGDVQAFQGGTVYEQDGDDKLGFVVQGTIRDRYASLRYEMGPLGWPRSDEEPWGTDQLGGMIQRFDNGRIRWFREGNVAAAFLTGGGEPLQPEVVVSPPPPGPPSSTYVPIADEVHLTPRDGMTGGVSHFATPGDPSTRGRYMGVSGEPADQPWDDWYAAMRFAYCAVQPDPNHADWVKPVSGTSDMRLKSVLPTRRLLVTSKATGRQIVVRPADWGPGAWAVPGRPKYRVIDLSPAALDVLGVDTDSEVSVAWCDPARPLGPVR